MGGAGLQEQETLSLGMRRFEGSKGRLLGGCFNLHRHVGSHFLRVCKLVRNTSPAEGQAGLTLRKKSMCIPLALVTLWLGWGPSGSVPGSQGHEREWSHVPRTAWLSQAF